MAFFSSFVFMKYAIVFVVVSLLFSCSERDEQFCQCLQFGQELNTFSSTVLKEGATEQTAKKLRELKAKKQRACDAFKTMDGPEMIQKKAACMP